MINLHRKYFKDIGGVGILVLAIVIALACSTVATPTTSLLKLTPTAAVAANQGQAIVNAASTQAGQKYCLDGGNTSGPTHGAGGSGCTSPSTVGFDCSGLSLYAVYQATGITLPHSAVLQAAHGGQLISNPSSLLPGDLVFFGGGSLSNAEHVGIYAGGGEMWDANNYNVPVQEHSLSWEEGGSDGLAFDGGVRYWTSSSGDTWTPTQSFDWPHMTSLEENGLKSNGSGIGGAQYITSPNGEFAFMVSGNGYAALYGGPQSKELWSTNTSGSISATSGGLVLQSDGNLVLYNGNGNVLWSTGTGGNSGDNLVVQNDGNVVLYSWSGKAMWSTGTGGGFEADNLWKNNLTDGQNMTTCEFIQSADGRFTLLEQCNGDLVLYGPGYSTMWHSNTANYGGASLAMQTDGNLVIYAPNNGPAIWSTGTGGNSGDSLVVQNDGNVVLYSWSGKPMWATGT